MFAQAEFISFLAAFITILNGNARALGKRLFHLVDEENYSLMKPNKKLAIFAQRRFLSDRPILD